MTAMFLDPRVTEWARWSSCAGVFERERKIRHKLGRRAVLHEGLGGLYR